MDDGRVLTLFAALGIAGAAALFENRLQLQMAGASTPRRRRNPHERRLSFEEERFYALRPKPVAHKQSLVSSLSELERFPLGTRLRREAYGAGVAERFFVKGAGGVWSRDDGVTFEPRQLRRLIADRTLYVVEPGSGSRGVARSGQNDRAELYRHVTDEQRNKLYPDYSSPGTMHCGLFAAPLAAIEGAFGGRLTKRWYFTGPDGAFFKLGHHPDHPDDLWTLSSNILDFGENHDRFVTWLEKKTGGHVQSHLQPRSGSRGVARAAHLTPLVAELSCRPTRGLVGSTLYIVRVGPSVSGSSETSWGSAVASALFDAPKAPRGPEVVEAVLRAVEESAFVFSNQDDFGDALGGIHDRMHDMDAAALRRFEDWYEDETGMTFGDI